MCASTTSSSATPSTMTKPTRPYTEYNIFFQLEREYILQVLLGVEPAYEPLEIFHASQPSYRGPNLPPRYADLVLPNDWFVPGKEKRRKRRHRKSHGAIGFHELSLKIADAWKNVDDESRTFCAVLSDIGMLEYKSAIRKFKMSAAGQDGLAEGASNDDKNGNTKPAKKPSKKTNHAAKKSPAVEITPFPFEIPSLGADETTKCPARRHVSYNEEEQSQTETAKAKAKAKPDNVTSGFDAQTDLCIAHYFSDSINGNQISHAFDAIQREIRSNCNASPKSSSYVDMEDDEIISIWQTSQTENIVKSTAAPPRCTGYSNTNCHSNFCFPDDVEHMRILLAQQQSHLRNVARYNFSARSA
ncbi:hypothetical protein ACHAXS_003194 [Conticribra weissflogii]